MVSSIKKIKSNILVIIVANFLDQHSTLGTHRLGDTTLHNITGNRNNADFNDIDIQ